MHKLLAMNVAATLAAAVISNLDDNLTVDVNIQDPNLRAENLMTWEVFRIFYHAVKAAVEDEASWPAPKGGTPDLLPGIGEGVKSLLQNPLVGEWLRKLIGSLPAPLPSPGQPAGGRS